MPGLQRVHVREGPLGRSGGLQRRDILTLLSSCLQSLPVPPIDRTNEKPEEKRSLLTGPYRPGSWAERGGGGSINLEEQTEAGLQGHLPAGAMGTSVTLPALSSYHSDPGSHMLMVASQDVTDPPPSSNHSPA